MTITANHIALPQRMLIPYRQHRCILLTDQECNVMQLISIEREEPQLTDFDVLDIVDKRATCLQEILDLKYRVFIGEVSHLAFLVYKEFSFNTIEAYAYIRS